jgi:hypothetical protein
MHATIEQLWELRSLRVREEAISGELKHYTYWYPRVEAGSNTSTVALRVVGEDEKRTQCLGYN